MIRDHEQFESTLDEATQLLAAQPQEGSSEHERLMGLMKAIAAYRPVVLSSARDVSDAGRLSQRLDAFEAQLPPHFSTHWSAMVGGDLRGDAGAPPLRP